MNPHKTIIRVINSTKTGNKFSEIRKYVLSFDKNGQTGYKY